MMDLLPMIAYVVYFYCRLGSSPTQPVARVLKVRAGSSQYSFQVKSGRV